MLAHQLAAGRVAVSGGILLMAVGVGAARISATSPSAGSRLAERVVAFIAAGGAVGLAGGATVGFALIGRTTLSTAERVASVQAIAVANAGCVADRITQHRANGIGAAPVTAGVIAHPSAFGVASQRHGQNKKEYHCFTVD